MDTVVNYADLLLKAISGVVGVVSVAYFGAFKITCGIESLC